MDKTMSGKVAVLSNPTNMADSKPSRSFDASPPPQQQQAAPSHRSHRGGRSRRSNSDIPAAILEHSPAPQHGFQSAPFPPYYGGQIPPSNSWGMYGSPHQQINPALNPPGAAPFALPYIVTHKRTNSLDQSHVLDPNNSFNNQYPPPGYMPPMPYGATSPVMWHPQQHDMQQQWHQQPSEAQSLMHAQSQQSQQRLGQIQQQQDSNRRRRNRNHRKSHSSSAAMPEYGAFWNANSVPDSATTSELRHASSDRLPSSLPTASGSLGRNQKLIAAAQNSSTKFSPRNDLRKMFTELSPKQSQRKGNNMSAGRMNASTRVPFSPKTTPVVITSTMRPSSMHSIRMPSPGGGGEPATIFKGVPSKESDRKKHIRQQSAQEYMEQIKGVEQPLKCRNVAFLLLFVFHLLFVGVYLGQKFSKDAFVYHDPAAHPDMVTIFYHNLLFIAMLSGAFAIASSTLLLVAMTIFARNFLQIALVFIITLSFIWGTVGVGLSPKTVVPVTGIIALGLAVAYTFIVWDRIPFSATNLLSALSGIRAFPSTVILAIFMQVLTLAWCIYFSVVASGLYNAIQAGKIALPKNAIVLCYVLLGFSFYWTYQVIHGCIKAATAGVISGWWHTPGYPDQVRDSCFKTLFYSIGSICFGGLLIGPVTIIRQLSVLVRPSQTEPSLLCLHECINFFQVCVSRAVDAMTVRCNAYCFTYVGMYHYGFLEAGMNATELFEKRGWTMIVSDDLVPNVLFLTSLVIGGVTGCVAHFVSQLYNLSITSNEDPGVSSFFLGTWIGLVITSITFSVVSSSVNTVLVCFASSPVDFERNHPQLSTEMRAAWREVWPGALEINYYAAQNDFPELNPFI